MRGGVWHRDGGGEEPGRGRALEARLFLLLSADLALRDSFTCESRPALLPCPKWAGRECSL